VPAIVALMTQQNRLTYILLLISLVSRLTDLHWYFNLIMEI